MKKNRQVIQLPLVTEKITNLQENLNQYAFQVDRLANKIEIKKAVEERFDVHVEKVRTMNYQGKLKRMGRFEGRRASWKKAIVTLKAGQKIELFENV
ncbi:50S ribosomal protein L23 [bacterium]|nr:50S ribosomal protein L23 [FCB group bacterium]MBL7190943.1 50S ribosomal protein L23 [bacterium]